MISKKARIINSEDFNKIKLIGKGGYASVWLVEDKNNGQQFALKEISSLGMNEKRKKEFFREVKTMVKLSHPFLLKIQGYSPIEPFLIITDYMPNGSVHNAYQNENSQKILTGTIKTKIAMGISHVMMHLHSNGIIHRDIKSMNVLLDDNYLPKLCDFGISRFVDTSSAILTSNLGTPHWMAPEALYGEEYSFPVDVYSYGMFLYEMLVHSIPWHGLPALAVSKKVVVEKKRPIIPENTPNSLRLLILACWSHDPNERPTFKSIYHYFKKSKIYFSDTDRSEIMDFSLFLDKYSKTDVKPDLDVATASMKRLQKISLMLNSIKEPDTMIAHLDWIYQNIQKSQNVYIFIKDKHYLNLPIRKNEFIDSCLDICYFVFSNYSMLITSEWADILEYIVKKRIQKSIVLFQFLCLYPTSSNIPLFGVFYNHFEVFLCSKYASDFLIGLFTALDSQIFKETCIDKCIDIFINCIGNYEMEVGINAMRFLSKLGVKELNMDYSILDHYINNPKVFIEAFMFIIDQDFSKRDQRFVNLFLENYILMQDAKYCLLIFSESEVFSTYLIQRPFWIKQGIPLPQDSLHVLLSLVRHSSIRKHVSDTQEVFSLIEYMVQAQLMLDSVTELISTMTVSETLFSGFRDFHLLEILMKRLTNDCDAHFLRSSLRMILSLSNQVYFPEYLLSIPILKDLYNAYPESSIIIKTIVSLSNHPLCALKMKEISFFIKLEKDSSLYQLYKENMRKVRYFT